MKSPILGLCFLGSCLSVGYGQTFSDDFERPNVAPTNNGADIGPGWVIGGATPEWEIVDGDIRVNPTTTTMVGNSVMWNTAANVTGGDFSVSSTMSSITNGRTKGIAFFVQDFDSFLAFRARAANDNWEVVQFDDGTETTVVDGNLPTGTTFPNAELTFTVASTAADNFDLTIVDEIAGSTLVSTSFSDSSLAFNSGFAGLHYELTNGQGRWRDINVIPEPSSGALFLGGIAALSLLRRQRRAR